MFLIGSGGITIVGMRVNILGWIGMTDVAVICENYIEERRIQKTLPNGYRAYSIMGAVCGARFDDIILLANIRIWIAPTPIFILCC